MTAAPAPRAAHGSGRAPVAGVELLALTGPALAAPVVAWWVVGDQSYEGDVLLDYAFRAPDLPAGASVALLVVSVAATLASLRLLLLRRGGLLRRDPWWWLVLSPAVAAGAVAGAGWRVMTAGVIGANIGAGLVVFFAGPLVLVLLVWSLVCAGVLLARRRRQSRPVSSQASSAPPP